MSNESYEQAEKWVLEQIDGQSPPCEHGELVTVGEMETCDCIPTLIVRKDGTWRLMSSVRLGVSSINATYEYLPR